MTKTKDKLNLKQELFCRYYTQNPELFGNATLAYAEAYGYDLQSLSRIRLKDENGREIIGSSEYDKSYNVCSVNGYKLLIKTHIQEFMRKCRLEMKTNDVIDSELIKIILQDHDRPSKISAIREYNKLEKRVSEKLELTGKDGGKLEIVFKRKDESRDKLGTTTKAT